MEFGRKSSGALRYLTEEELSRFMAEASKRPKYNCLFSLMLSFGLRSSEAAEISLADITEDKTIFIRAKKHGYNRQYDLSDELVRKIRKWLRCRTVESPWLFPHYHDPQKHATNWLVCRAFDVVAQAVGITGRSSHSLRHSTGVNLAKAGFTGPQISRHLRHRALSSSWVYCQAVEDRAQDQKALNLFEAFLAKTK